MYWFLLKKALPFTLTFIFGAALSGLFGGSEKKAEMVNLRYSWGLEDGRGHNHCRMRHRNLVAESKPLAILNVPDAVWPLGVKSEKGRGKVPVNVTFGADGRVQKVEPSSRYTLRDIEIPPQPFWNAVVKAAQEIRFTPEVINGVPVSVEKEVEIYFAAD